MWPFKRKPKYQLVTDGEKWAVKRWDGCLFYVAQFGTGWGHPDRCCDEWSWVKRETAETWIKRLLA